MCLESCSDFDSIACFQGPLCAVKQQVVDLEKKVTDWERKVELGEMESRRLTASFKLPSLDTSGSSRRK